MAGILDAFMRGYNFGDSIQQRQVDRQFQEEVRDRQRQEWTAADQDKLFGEAAREYQSIVGSDSLGDAVADPGKKQALVNWTNKYGKDLGLNDGALGSIEAQDFVPTGDGKAVPMLKASDPKTGAHISTGPLTADRSNRPDAQVVPLGNEDILGQIESARLALRTKSSGFNDYVTKRETADSLVQATNDFMGDIGAPSTAPQGLRAASVGAPSTGMANERFALNTINSDVVPGSPYATDAPQTPIDGMDPEEQAKLNAYLDASVRKNRGASNQGLRAAADQVVNIPAADVAPSATSAPAQQDTVEIRPGVFIPRSQAPQQPSVTPGATRKARRAAPKGDQRVGPPQPEQSAKDAVPSAPSSAPAEQKARVESLADDKAKQVAASVRAPSNEKQLTGMQTQVENIRPSGQITAKQKKALAQMYRLGGIDAATYERAMRTGRLSKAETEQVKLDARTLLVDSETGQVISSYANPAQTSTTASDQAKQSKETTQARKAAADFMYDTFQRSALGQGADSDRAKQIAGRAQERVFGTPVIEVLGLDVSNPTHQNYLFEANRRAQADEDAGRAGWWASLFGAKDDRVNDLTPYVLDQMRPSDNIPQIAKVLAAQKDKNGNTPDREEVAAMLLHATRIAQQEGKSVGQVIQELSNAQ